MCMEFVYCNIRAKFYKFCFERLLSARYYNSLFYLFIIYLFIIFIIIIQLLHWLHFFFLFLFS